MPDGRAPILPEHLDVGDGPPVVMLPGMEGAKEFWRFQVEPFSKKYRVVPCTYPFRAPSRASEVGDYAADILLLMDTLGIERAAVVAESFGGIVAQELAIEHPDRVAALVLGNTLDRPRRGAFGLNAFTFASLLQPLAFLPPRPAGIALLNWIGRRRGFVMDPTPGNADLAEYILDYAMEASFANQLDRIIAGSKVRNTERLPRIKAPTLVLRGTEDLVVPPEAILEFVGRIPGAELALIDGGGHCCQHTLPEATNRAILGWLERIGY